jgi:peptidoglycan/xylan/chitin deacetylase (PgdA/CDA1 family)
MSLSNLVRRLKGGELARRAVVVTFDDGYADNLHQAKPLLERYDVPATIFVTSGYVQKEREFWWDELDRLLLQPGRLPEMLCLNVRSICQWGLGKAAHYSIEDYERYRGWHVEEKHTPTPRHHLYRSLCQLLRPLHEKERRRILDGLLEWAGAESMVRATHRVLSPDEVSQLAEGKLVEVGAHTVTHPILSLLPAAAQRIEIQQGKAFLEDIMGHPVISFSYPYGSRSVYTEETVSIVREAAFACACSNFTGFVGRRTDCYQMPRVLVRDWDGNEFASRMEEWFRG